MHMTFIKVPGGYRFPNQCLKVKQLTIIFSGFVNQKGQTPQEHKAIFLI